MAAAEITLYSHGMIVRTTRPHVYRALVDYCRQLAEWSFEKPGPRQRPRRIMKKIYAGATKDRQEFRFHRNCLNDLIAHFDQQGIPQRNIEWKELPLPDPAPLQIDMNTNKQPREDQEPVIQHMAQARTNKVVDLQTGKGKAQPLSSYVKVPGGWKTMGEMSNGDQVVSYDGTISHVTGVFPQGVKPCYKVTFGDGRSTRACAEHLWKVYYVNTSKHKRWRVVDTLEMKRLSEMPNPRVYVPLMQPENDESVDLPISPYVLGVILGDGCIAHNQISITKDDPELFDRVREELPEDLTLHQLQVENTWTINRSERKGTNQHLDYLKSAGLQGGKAHVKFVPDEYKFGSTEQRLALLQGLLDTDGTVGGDTGTVSFSSTSPHLAADVQYLVRSLGGIAAIAERHPEYTYKGVKLKGRKAYQVNIRFGVPSALFRLQRKKERTNDGNQYAENLKLRVRSVELDGEEEMQCIAIDHPDRLYVTDNFVVTHNTLCSLTAMYRMGMRTMIQLRGGFIDQWIGDIQELFDVSKKDILVIRGRDSLQSLIHMAQQNELEASVILISWKTLYNFYKMYEHDPLRHIYEISPEQLFTLCQIGLRIVDEVHLDYHFNFRSDIYTNVPSTIQMSATLKTDDAFRRNMYEIALPDVDWYKGATYDVYIGAYAVHFSTRHPDKLRTQEYGDKRYSHQAYEKSIMKHAPTLNNYYDIIQHCLDRFYWDEQWARGQKAIIFCSLTKLCYKMAQHFQRIYPNVKVGVYVSETPRNDLDDMDIIFTTVESCGVAVDIPNLRTAILTRALAKREANEQIMGRLRRLKDWPDITPIFLYLVNCDVPKHIEYEQKKREQFDGKVLYHRTENPKIRL